MLYFFYLIFTHQFIISQCSTFDNGLNLYVFIKQQCPFCIKYDAVVENLITNIKLQNIQINITKIDCDLCDCSVYNVTGYPTTILKENNNELARFSGYNTCSSVTAFLDNNLCIKNGIYTSIKNCPTLSSFSKKNA